MTKVAIDCRKIVDEKTLHDVFAHAFGFPKSYGRNMDALIDCLGSLDDPKAGMSTIHAPNGTVVLLQLEHLSEFSKRLPQLFHSIIDCTAFVNFRQVEAGRPPVIALSYQK